MLRRFLLASTALAGLAACQTAPDKSVTDLIDKVALVVGAVANTLLPAVGRIAGIDPAVVATIGDYVAKMKDLVGQLVGVATVDAAKPVVQQIVDYMNAVFSALHGVNLPSGISSILSDVELLLPIIMAIVGLVAAPKVDRLSVDAAWVRVRAAARR